jgi:hypothetical protein
VDQVIIKYEIVDLPRFEPFDIGHTTRHAIMMIASDPPAEQTLSPDSA